MASKTVTVNGDKIPRSEAEDLAQRGHAGAIAALAATDTPPSSSPKSS